MMCIADKISGLRAKTVKNGCTPEEADSAAQMVQHLLSGSSNIGVVVANGVPVGGNWVIKLIAGLVWVLMIGFVTTVPTIIAVSVVKALWLWWPLIGGIIGLIAVPPWVLLVYGAAIGTIECFTRDSESGCPGTTSCQRD